MTKKIAIIGCGKIPKGRLDVLKSRAIKEFGDNVEFNVITMNQENKQTGSRYTLFEHMVDEYGLHLLDSQIDDITLIAAEINGIKSLREELEKLRAENQKLREALEEVSENLELQLSRLGCCGQGDHKDRKADNDDFGGIRVLAKAKEALKGQDNE